MVAPAKPGGPRARKPALTPDPRSRDIVTGCNLMTRILSITQRELTAFFFSPIAYAVLIVFLLASGIYFGTFGLVPGNDANLEGTFQWMVYVLVFAIPALTMRLFAEEYRSGMIETLMTLPIRDVEVVAGKFLGAFVFYLVLLASSLFYVVILAMKGNPDPGELAAGYLGMVLIGALYISVGMLTSAFTGNQVVALILSWFMLIVLTLLAELLASQNEGTLRVVLQYISIVKRHEGFRSGVVGIKDMVFFVSGTIFFLFVATRVLESKRWR